MAAYPNPDDLVVPPSILDTDLYKFTMQQAVFEHFPNAWATYRFTNRNADTVFTRKSIDILRASVNQFSRLSMSEAEKEWLAKACPYFKPAYRDFLGTYRFKPEQVEIKFIPAEGTEEGPDQHGNLSMTASGPWIESILWEVPLMSTLCEIYYKHVDTDWTYEGQEDLAYQKGKTLLANGCVFNEFGSRRRRSLKTHDLVIQGLKRAVKDAEAKSGKGQEGHNVEGTPSGARGEPGKLSGTSNVYLAMKHDLTPTGTIAHEWFMGVATAKGYENANTVALRMWQETYGNVLLVALTDTFSSDAFFKNLAATPDIAHTWAGLRQDSGDPFAFAPRAKAVYEGLGIDHREKVIVYSDALSVEKAVRLLEHAGPKGLGFKVAFGIGTNFTNDFRKKSTADPQSPTSTGAPSEALNIVIKLDSLDGKPCVKISDDLTKNTGDKETVRYVKQIFGLPV
ncbi:nicotinate phosphoribosyltransferase [Schizophyllum commune Tattone D]|nr:nicotinate phosphoribosyltransferase [Schizophyllum commune Tattone D]